MGTTRQLVLFVCSLVAVGNCGEPHIASLSQSGISVLSEYIIMHVCFCFWAYTLQIVNIFMSVYVLLFFCILLLGLFSTMLAASIHLDKEKNACRTVLFEVVH